MICSGCKEEVAVTTPYAGRDLCDPCLVIRKEKQRAYAKAYYMKNRESYRAYQRDYQKTHISKTSHFIPKPLPIKTHYHASSLMRLSVEKFEFVVKMMAKREYFYMPMRRT